MAKQVIPNMAKSNDPLESSYRITFLGDIRGNVYKDKFIVEAYHILGAVKLATSMLKGYDAEIEEVKHIVRR